MKTNQCEKHIFHFWKDRRCPNPGKVQVNGKWFCGVHNPNKDEGKGKIGYKFSRKWTGDVAKLYTIKYVVQKGRYKILEGNAAFSYATFVSTEHHTIYETKEDATKAYIKECEAAVISAQLALDKSREELTAAKEML